MTQRSVGICLGASNIKVVELIAEREVVAFGRCLAVPHDSNPRQVMTELAQELCLDRYELGAVTGRKFRDLLRTSTVTEAEAVEQALECIQYALPAAVDEGGEQTAFGREPESLVTSFRGHPLPWKRWAPSTNSPPWAVSSKAVVVSLGAESFVAYVLDRQGHISTVQTGNKCASGTGEFFQQQIRRMDLDTAEALRQAEDSPEHVVSGRCSVFCKSDCTHALNKGIPVGRVTAGLCSMLAEKVLELIVEPSDATVVAIGGVTKNGPTMAHLRRRVKTLVIPAYAEYFEALGAAYFALRQKRPLGLDQEHLFHHRASSFAQLPPIEAARDQVSFRSHPRGTARSGDRCILGLDVGSTTTKAVLIRQRDDKVLASTYLRTNGDPVGAARRCYQDVTSQLEAGVGESQVKVLGLGVTGSGRHIAGLHAGTEAVINEIIAHATGAAFFDPSVDTIFEIGGQDAKYTHLTHAVPTDYAMNEACSAGTGSFLEEAAQEGFNLDYRDIEKVALQGDGPPNFNDQCAAFISSDIKTATHEGISPENIIAGLVYSVCMNYSNRVKGQRPVGRTIFMQGGVCYNRAVPLAMAQLVNRPIVVPPDPGLIGAFGVALEVGQRLRRGALEAGDFRLTHLAQREISYGKSFVCKGGQRSKAPCDRRCVINVPVIEGRKHPFGGACDRYSHGRSSRQSGRELDFVRQRQARVFESVPPSSPRRRPRIGINRSYFMHSYYPIFSTFFRDLGFEPVVPEVMCPDGVKRRRSSFCFPGEIAHGYFQELLNLRPEYIFLPKIMSVDVANAPHPARERKSTCVLVQSEAYYLKSAFKDEAYRPALLAPIVDFAHGLDSQESTFVGLAHQLGQSTSRARRAYRRAVDAQLAFQRSLKLKGQRLLRELAQRPDDIAVVIFGRSYNAFADEANMGIPAKLAGRGIMTIPWDCLPFEEEPGFVDMCWGSGQELLRAARFVKKHPQLYATWVTNFSCGPDSFMVGYFRDIMQTKPSLTLELDSHTADAGVTTRIEAFLDIVQRSRELRVVDAPPPKFQPARAVLENCRPFFYTSEGERVSFLDRDRVRLLLPSMGPLSTDILRASFEGIGIRSTALPLYEFDELKRGREYSSCKECLPLQLVVGGLLRYLEEREDQEELLAYFMPFTPGNCRFAQYRVFINNLIEKQQIRNVSLFSLNAENGYSTEAFGPPERITVLKAFIIADVMEDIHNALTVLAQEPAAAEAVFRKQWQRVLDCFEEWRPRDLDRTLRSIARELAQIKLRYPLKDARKVALMGEIFVRRDHYSCAELMKRLHERDIVVKRSHFFEWLKYTDTIIKAGIYEPTFSLQQRLQFEAKYLLQHHYEKKIKKILAQSGLYEYEVADIKKIFEFGRHFFDVRFRGESMLVVGGFFKEMFHSFHGLIAVGPFACMPTRVIEAVLSAEATMGVMRRLHGRNGHQLPELGHDASLPFLPLELDGNPLPQILEARIEAFCLQIDRMHRLLTGPVHQNPRSATSGGAAEVLESTPTSADDVQPSA